MSTSQGLPERIIAGQHLSVGTALELAAHESTQRLMAMADTVRQALHGNSFHTCAILNARCGGCGEDCRFCAQSAHHQTYGPSAQATMLSLDKAQAIAAGLDHARIARVSLVTSGRAADKNTLARLQPIYQGLRERYRFRFCASLGLLNGERLRHLRDMGVERYHCNLETAASYFPQICTTHSFADKVRTLEDARRAGLELCSGGIIGLGESMGQRIELAQSLRELDVRSVPLNIMTPIKGTPLAGRPTLQADEVLRSIALFRLMLPRAVLRMAGGRQLLGSQQYDCFRAGAHGAIVGNYLTTHGMPLVEDLAAIQATGFTLEGRTGPQRQPGATNE